MEGHKHRQVEVQRPSESAEFANPPPTLPPTPSACLRPPYPMAVHETSTEEVRVDVLPSGRSLAQASSVARQFLRGMCEPAGTLRNRGLASREAAGPRLQLRRQATIPPSVSRFLLECAGALVRPCMRFQLDSFKMSVMVAHPQLYTRAFLARGHSVGDTATKCHTVASLGFRRGLEWLRPRPAE